MTDKWSVDLLQDVMHRRVHHSSIILCVGYLMAKAWQPLRFVGQNMFRLAGCSWMMLVESSICAFLSWAAFAIGATGKSHRPTKKKRQKKKIEVYKTCKVGLISQPQ